MKAIFSKHLNDYNSDIEVKNNTGAFKPQMGTQKEYSFDIQI
jgi:hypothetical protein